MVETQEVSSVLNPIRAVKDAGAALYNAAYDHISNTSAAQLALEGVALSAGGLAVARVGRSLLAKDAAKLTDQLPEFGISMLPANRSAAGVNLRLGMTDSGIQRAVTVHLPPGFDPNKSTSMYYLLDGVQVGKPAGNMSGINGWGATADAFSAKATGQMVTVSVEQAVESAPKIYGIPIPGSIFGKPIPKLSSWNFDHGFLNKQSGFNDVDFVSRVVDRSQRTARVEGNYLVGFSDGGLLAHDVAATMRTGSIDGVATVASTMLKDSKLMPQPGVRGIFINMKDDPTVPLAGGAGPKLSKYLVLAGHKNILQSSPRLQELRYAEANGIKTAPAAADGVVAQAREYFLSPADTAKVKAFTITKPGAGHTWPGRAAGDGTSTSFTKTNGGIVSKEEFSANDVIVRFFEEGKKIQRRL